MEEKILKKMMTVTMMNERTGETSRGFERGEEGEARGELRQFFVRL